MTLPHCDQLFEKFLDPWYSQGDRTRKAWKATRPDLVTMEDYAGRKVEELAVLNQEGQDAASSRINVMLDACRGDWPRYLKVVGSLDVRWIEAFDEHYDRERVMDVIGRSDPKDFSNDYLILVCEFGAALGQVLREKEPRLVWVFDWPYWESSLVDTRSGSVIPPFHWAVKKFSEYGLEDGFAAKIDMCVHVLNEKKG